MISLFPSRQVAIELFSFSIHWYGILYAVGFIVGLLIAKRLQKYKNLEFSDSDWSGISTAVIVGVLLGGRLGYIVLYDLLYFLQNPLQIFAVWQGGMSSHGGFIGVLIAVYYQSKKRSLPILQLLDILIVPIAIGLALGRVGNFINLELYGTVTTVPWAITIPNVEGLRHPTQLYAIFKNVWLAVSAYALLRYVKDVKIHGLVTGVFLMQYAILRSIVELYRVPTHSVVDFFGYSISRGQLYSVPIFFVGVYVCLFALRKMNKR